MSTAVHHLPARVRPMLHGDLAHVADIERRSYEFPWTQGIFRDCLLAGYTCIVLETGEELLGYGIVSIAAAEAHLLNLCIDPRFRRLGYGERLLDELIRRAREAIAERMLLEVRPSNRSAIDLYRSRGFRPIGTRRGYYQANRGREDAVVYTLPLLARDEGIR